MTADGWVRSLMWSGASPWSELRDGLYERTATRFAGAPNVDIHHGDALELVCRPHDRPADLA